MQPPCQTANPGFEDIETDLPIRGLKQSNWTFVLFMFFLLSNSVACNEDRRNSVTIHVLVASSAQDAMDSAADRFLQEISQPDADIVIAGASSSSLAQQIMSGAPANLFVSANPAWAAKIEDQVLRTTILCSNRLVLATNRQNPRQIATFEDLASPEVKSIAIGGRSVPVGEYAFQAIENLPEPIRRSIKDKLVFGKDSSGLVAWLETNEVDAAFVYASDTLRSTGLKQVIKIDPEFHDPILYSVSLLSCDDSQSSAETELSSEFFQWLASEQAKAIFKDSGFQIRDTR